MVVTDVEAIAKLRSSRDKIYGEIGKVIFGQQTTVDHMLIAVMAGGHCLLVGVPGLAKTTLVQTLAQTLDLSFGRIQFTPDLMPSDITGTEILEEDPENGRKSFRFIEGPIFSQVLLADEINRTPPKTQAALLQAMQEGLVTVGTETLPVGAPFFVLATQNPIEQEGTYPLPEAQLDRFFFQLTIDYPLAEEEEEIARTTTSDFKSSIQPIIGSEELIAAQRLIRRVPIADHLVKQIVRIVRSSRPTDEKATDFVKEMVNWGAGPRASQFIVLASKARAALDGRYNVAEEDIFAVVPSVLCHRIVVNYHAEAQNIRSETVIDHLLSEISIL